MLSILDGMLGLINDFAADAIGGLMLTHEEEVHVGVLHVLLFQEESLAVFPQVCALEVIVFRGRAVLAILPVNLNVVEGPLSRSLGHVHSKLLELNAA